MANRSQVAESYNYDTFRRHIMEEDMHFSGGPQPGQPAPDFDLATVAGRRFRLADFRGRKPVLIEFGSIT
jgi:peroxiredoxin